MKHILSILFILTAVVGLLTSCQQTDGEIQGEPLEFTVLTQEEIPSELLEVIQTHKQNEIKMSYKLEDSYYIIRGYGQQKTGGYSISVNACALAEDGIHVDFSLLGPQTEEAIANEPSFPCIVLKLAYREVPVIFD